VQSQPRNNSKLSASVHHQLNLYALAATAAGVGLVGSAQPSAAKIVYTSANITISPMTTVPLDLNHDGFKDFSFYNYGTGWAHGSSEKLTVWPQGSRNMIRGRSDASALRAGVRIGPAGQFSFRANVMGGWFVYGYNGRYSSGYFGLWANGGKGVQNRYLGLKFVVKGKVHFGWARLTVSTSEHKILGKLTGYAYETVPGKAIIAGKTKGPDVATVSPASLGHLAAGASAIPAWRVRQTAVTTH
jgi:hypothetical protein